MSTNVNNNSNSKTVCRIEGVCLFSLEDGDVHLQEALEYGTLELLSRSEHPTDTEPSKVIIHVNHHEFEINRDTLCVRNEGVFFFYLETRAYSVVFAENIPSVYLDSFQKQIETIAQIDVQCFPTELTTVTTTKTAVPTEESETIPELHEIQKDITEVIKDEVKEELKAQTDAQKQVSETKAQVEAEINEKKEDQVKPESESSETEKQDEAKPTAETAVAYTETTLVLAETDNLSVRFMNNMATRLDSGSKYLSQGISDKATIISTNIYLGGAWMKTKMNARDHDVVVSKLISTPIKVTSCATYYAATATKKFFDTFAWAAGSVGSRVGNYLVGDKESQSSPFTQAALNLGYTGVRSVVDLLDAIENATKEVVGAASTSTVSVARYRYGREVSELIEKTFNTGGDACKIYFAVRGAALRSLATRAVVQSVSSGAKTYQEVKVELRKKKKASSTSSTEEEKEKIKPVLTQQVVQIHAPEAKPTEATETSTKSDAATADTVSHNVAPTETPKIESTKPNPV